MIKTNLKYLFLLCFISIPSIGESLAQTPPSLKEAGTAYQNYSKELSQLKNPNDQQIQSLKLKHFKNNAQWVAKDAATASQKAAKKSFDVLKMFFLGPSKAGPTADLISTKSEPALAPSVPAGPVAATPVPSTVSSPAKSEQNRIKTTGAEDLQSGGATPVDFSH